LTERIAQAFDRGVRARGESYVGRVTIVRGSAEQVLAKVQGTRRYEVRISQRDGVLQTSCDCPYAADGDYCKHEWATLRVAEMRGLLGAVARDAVRLAPAEYADEVDDFLRDDLDGEDDDLDDGDDELVPDRRRAPLRLAPPTHAHAGAPVSPPAQLPRRSWRGLFADVDTALRHAAVPSAWHAGGRILYVFDVRATLESGSLTIDVAVQHRKRDGSWAKLISTAVPREVVPDLPDPADRRILTLLGAVQPRASYYSSWQLDPATSPRRVLGHPLPLELVEAMCATGRALLRPADPKAELASLSWDPGDPWVFELRLRRAADECVLDGVLRRATEVVPLAEVDLALAGGLVLRECRVARLDDGAAFAWIAQLRRSGSIVAPWPDLDGLAERLCKLPALPPLALAGDLGLAEVRPVPTPRARIEEGKQLTSSAPRWTVSLSFRYGSVDVTEEPACAAVFDAAGRGILHRDVPRERAATDLLAELGAPLRVEGYRPAYRKDRSVVAKAVPALVRALCDAGWIVEVAGKPARRAGAIRIEVTSGIDWFDLDGVVEFGDQVARLPELLAARRRGEGFVRLGDGSSGLLPEEWLARNGLLFGLGGAAGDKLRFRRSQAALLDVLLAAQPEVCWDDGFRRARKELAAFERLEPGDPPRGFSGTLREYQRHGVGWMGFLRRFGFGGCLADDMGLGKTVQVLALLWSRKRELARAGKPKPSLVVVPRSLVFNWRAEAARFVPKLRVLDLAGDPAARAVARLDEHDIVLTTYGLLRRDARRLGELSFDYAILDEAQIIKNPASVAAKAARLLVADHRLALSGTPIENHLGELWSLFEFLNPGLLGTSAAFRGVTGRDPDEETRDRLSRALRPFFLRRTKAEVAADLPPRVEQTLWCELGQEERALYDELRDHYRAALLGRIEREGLAKSRMHVLEALLRLRQAALHPGLLDPDRADGMSSKLAMLLEQLEEVRAQGGKALVFSQFTSLLDIVQRRLDEAGVGFVRLDGQTRDRSARVERFRGDRALPVFLISLKAGGLGLNLVEAQYVFLLDPWWNPAVEAQAIDRTHRIGQTKTVFAYRLVARETIEEKILELQAKKRALADAILGAGSATLRGLTRADVELLLSS
jgi:hypothetical protein